MRLTEVQKTLLVETVKGLEMRVHWQLRDMRGQLRGPGAKKYDGDMALGHDIDMAALQLYSFLNHIKAQQENLG